MNDLVTRIDNPIDELLHAKSVIDASKQAKDNLVVPIQSFDEVVLQCRLRDQEFDS